MADYVIDSAQVQSVSRPLKDRVALEAIDRGETVYYDNEQAGLTDANVQQRAVAKGMAVSKVAAGEIVSIAEEGAIVNIGTVTGLNAGDPLFIANTPGKLSPFADLIVGQWPCLFGWSLSTNPVLVVVAPSVANVQKAIG